MISTPCAKYWASYIPFADRDAKHHVCPEQQAPTASENNCQKGYDGEGCMNKQT